MFQFPLWSGPGRILRRGVASAYASIFLPLPVLPRPLSVHPSLPSLFLSPLPLLLSRSVLPCAVASTFPGYRSTHQM